MYIYISILNTYVIQALKFSGLSMTLVNLWKNVAYK